MNELNFFDCNIIYGLPSERKPLMPVPDITALLNEMKAVGIREALVRREEQICTGAVFGNNLVAEDVRNTDNLWGVWAILPAHTHELPSPERMFTEMKHNRIAAWTFYPDIHGFVFHHMVLKEYFSLAEEKKIPLLIDLAFIPVRDLMDVLEHYPQLIVILSSPNVWPNDRLLRPIIHEFHNSYLELSMYIGDGTIEDIVAEYGSRKILFGTGFYKNHFGGYMLMLKTAGITREDKQLIASGNLRRILESVVYD